MTNVASTLHDNPTTYFEDVTNPFFISKESVTFTSKPTPSIEARTSAYNPIGVTATGATGLLSYDIGISGPASSWVPVSYQGQYAMAGNDISGYSGYDNVVNSTSINLTITANSELTGLSYQCSRKCDATSYAGEYSVSGWDDTFLGIDSVTGNMYGTVALLTDQFGLATATVSLSASAGTWVGGPSDLQNFNAMAFIDPEFHIDADWLALNPGATL